VTVDSWLASRTPTPPEELTARIRDALGAALSLPAREASAACLDAMARIVEELLEAPEAGRDRALDLLAADALITYAFEAASDSPLSLSERAAAAMSRIAALGDAGGAPSSHDARGAAW